MELISNAWTNTHVSDAVSTRQRGVQSVEVSIRVLKALAAARGTISRSGLPICVGMPAAKAHRYLVSLIEPQMFVPRGSTRAQSTIASV